VSGVKHLIECHCVLPLYKQSQKIINHKFTVYSKFDEAGNVLPKLCKCNNCDTLHYIPDICKSEIRGGKDETTVILDVDDISLMLSDKLCSILRKFECDLATWEHALDIVEEERWGDFIVLKRDVIGEVQQVKLIEILSEAKVKIRTETIKDIAR